MSFETRFDPLLVVVSIAVAILASYVALNLAHSITQAKGRAQLTWLSFGAIAMGVGIWSMHFIGMLAFEMPGMDMAYDIPMVILSIAVAVGASAVALYVISRIVVPLKSVLFGGVAMAVAIAGMHYLGMYSMRMPMTIKWNIYLVALSVLIALAASYAALLMAIGLRNKTDRQWQLLLASTVMGFAISGMHYTGMIAATFTPSHMTHENHTNLLVSSRLIVAVISMTLLILGLALAGSISQRIMAGRKKRAEEILSKSEQRFRMLVDAVKDYAIFMLDPEGYITSWNSGAQRICGYARNEVVGKHFSVFYAAQDSCMETAEDELKIAKETGHFESEGKRMRKDGTVFWANIVLVPLYESDGQLSGFSKVVRDVTHLKKAESRLKKLNEELEKRVEERTAELQTRETQLRAITNAMPVFVGQLDKEERFLYANNALCRWFGRECDQIIGQTFRTILGEAKYKTNEDYIRRALQGETIIYERLTSSGTASAILNITYVPEFNQEHQVVGLILVATDITKYKEIEAELNNAKEAADAANTTKSAFLANMSHEIRTPLGAILGFSELLLNPLLTPSEKVNSVEVIKRNGRLLSNIINDILDLSKVEAGKMEIEKVSVPFSELMAEIESLLSLEAHEKGLQLNVTVKGAIPNSIQTDPLRLRQILLNIVGNAIKFTQRGSVNIKVGLLPDENRAMKLAFIVKDTGEGISASQVTRLFTPFTQADVSTTRKFGGTGLGLVLSKRLANALGGDVILSESTPGIGSTFVITIDPGESDETMLQIAKPEPKPAPITEEQNVNLTHLRILVVDDSPDNQVLITRFLHLAGAFVETANNGKEAVERALSGGFSLVLMDLQMPEMDGYEATRRLREQGFTKPIIALTAHAMKEERRRSLESGFNDHLTKPINRQCLLRALSEYAT